MLEDFPVRGGVETVVIDFLEELLKSERYDITLVVEVMAYSGIKNIIKQYPHLSYCRKYPDEKPINPIKKWFWNVYKYWYRFRLSRILRKKYDIIIDYKNGEFLEFLQSVKDTPILVWLQGSMEWVEKTYTPAYFSNCTDVICLSHKMQKELSSWFASSSYHIPTVHSIYNGIDREKINKLASIEPSLLPQSPYFIYVSRLDKDKDSMTVIHAYYEFEKVHKSGIHLYIIGDGAEKKLIDSMIDKLGMRDKIHTLGFIDRPYFYMKHAVANILSSYNEGFGMVLVEAMTLGTLNIASDCPSSIQEILLGGKAGLLFTPGSVTELKERLCDVYYKRVDTNIIVEKATESLTRFDIANVMDKIHNLIEQTIYTKR